QTNSAAISTTLIVLALLAKPVAQTDSLRYIASAMISRALSESKRATEGVPVSFGLVLLQEEINQLIRRVVHLDLEAVHATGEVVEHPDRRDRHQQPEGRRH